MKFKTQFLPLLICVSLLLPAKVLLAAGAPNSNQIDSRSYHLGGIASWSEVVSIGIKKMALSSAMSEGELDSLLEAAMTIVGKAGVSAYREPAFITTDLFPLSATGDKQVLIIYRGTTLDEYLALKKRKQALLAADEYAGEARRNIAWSLGKLLSNPDAKIEQLLDKNNDKQ